MKKVLNLLKANVLIILGAILFLIYVNDFASKEGNVIAEGVFGLILSLYLIVIGIIFVAMGNKINKTAKAVLEVIGASTFALFAFVGAIFTYDVMDKANSNAYVTVGPTAWILVILQFIISFTFMGFFPVAKFVKNKAVTTLGYIFSGLFVTLLFLTTAFDITGTVALLGNIPFILLMVYVLFAFFIFESLSNKEPAAVESKAEEIKEIEQEQEEEDFEEAMEEEVEEKQDSAK